MPYDRRPDRRPGGGRPNSPGRPPGGRPPFGDRPAFGDRPQRPRDEFRPREDFGERPRDEFRPREDFGERPPRPRDEFTPQPPRDARPGGFTPRPMDDGGMSIRLDPRRLNALKLLAGEAGLRPGELVTRWVEERLDAARPGGTQPTMIAPAATAAPAAAAAPEALRALAERVDELAARFDAMTRPAEVTAADHASDEPAPKPRRGRPPKVALAAAAAAEAPAVTKSVKPKRGRPRKTMAAPAARRGTVALHDEIAAVLAEHGPKTAAELATVIGERGLYLAPRSAKPLDAATVNSRVSNAKYRPRFVRADGRIGLATG